MLVAGWGGCSCCPTHSRLASTWTDRCSNAGALAGCGRPPTHCLKSNSVIMCERGLGQLADTTGVDIVVHCTACEEAHAWFCSWLCLLPTGSATGAHECSRPAVGGTTHLACRPALAREHRACQLPERDRLVCHALARREDTEAVELAPALAQCRHRRPLHRPRLPLQPHAPTSCMHRKIMRAWQLLPCAPSEVERGLRNAGWTDAVAMHVPATHALNMCINATTTRSEGVASSTEEHSPAFAKQLGACSGAPPPPTRSRPGASQRCGQTRSSAGMCSQRESLSRPQPRRRAGMHPHQEASPLSDRP